MALKKCRECGKEISSSAKVCPNCGKKNPTANTAAGCFGLVIIVSACVWIGHTAPSCSNSSSPPTGNSSSPPTGSGEQKEIDLHASVKFTGSEFVITNNDNFDWTSVELTVNGGLFKGYKYKTSALSAGQTYT